MSVQRQAFGPDGRRAFFRYLPVSPEARQWGAYVVDAGYTLIPPGAPYPPCLHPPDHHFTWEAGRVLHSPTLVYITRGAGTLETAASGLLRVEAGDVFALLPGAWHRYRPDPASGWDEYWVECDGAQVRRLLALRPVRPEAPVLRVGNDEDLLRAFLDIVDTARREPPEHPILLGALALGLIARLFSAQRRERREGPPAEEILREARTLLLHEGGRRQRLDAVAAQVNMGYSNFRRLFKDHTGLPPRQYALQVRLQRAMTLLAQTRRPVGGIAEDLGFESVSYFSRFFKRKTGLSPLAYRRRHAPPGTGRKSDKNR